MSQLRMATTTFEIFSRPHGGAARVLRELFQIGGLLSRHRTKTFMSQRSNSREIISTTSCCP